MKRLTITTVALLILACVTYISVSLAGDVKIADVKARSAGSSWSFSVTLKHADEGWDHYADLWQIYTLDGKLLGERILAHPHVQEQPFTRSLSGVQVPDGIDEVIIRARDTVHGVSAQEYKVLLPH
ncbi:MAG: hypothetical protein ABJL55_18420 [Roseibium sp.]